MADISEKELVEYRTQRKLELKREFIKQHWNPERLGNKESLFDPAIQRFMSMKATQYDHFKPTPRTMRIGVALMLPMAFFVTLVMRERLDLEHQCSTGQIAYKDRRCKFMV